MIRIFFKTTLRNWWKSKTNSLLNIGGLAIGIACASLIFLWVEDELSYDQFNAKKDRLYYVMMNQYYDAGIFTHGSTPGPLGPAMQAEMPAIASSCRTNEGLNYPLFSVDDRSFYAGGKYAEPSLFSMFTLPFVEGDPKHPFSQLHSLVITQKAATKFFGNEQKVLGRKIRMDNKQDYFISGVVKDIPGNASLQFEWVAPFEIMFRENQWLNGWGNFGISTYVELKPGASVALADKYLFNAVQKRDPASIGHPFLFNMNDWHLRAGFTNGKLSGGQITYIRLFSVIAWIILLIACINFMNLATARSEKRAREVGVRKVLGAEKRGLALQFVSEALLMSFLATVLAIVMISLLLPAFNGLVQKNLSIGLGTPLHIAAFLLIAAVCGLVAGSYPSFYLSSFNPVFVLKGIKLKTGSAAVIRKSLVVLQFTISIVLIIGTIVIYQQIQHVKDRNLGFNKNNLIDIKVQGDLLKNYAAVKQTLLETGVVDNTALTDHATIYAGNNTGGLEWEGKDPAAQVLVSVRAVSPEFIKTSGMQLLQGRDFYANAGADSLNVIITASLAKLMAKGNVLGKTISSDNESPEMRSYTVVGVVDDYVYGNMYGKPDPVVFFCLPQYASNLYVRIKEDVNMKKGLARLEAVMKKYNPAYPFDYQFVDEQFNSMFKSEMLIEKLSRVFAGLAIFISCLGLFGLAAYTAERRTKEIGIRKVLGASVTGIATLLSSDFLQLVILSAVLAFPLAWWVMNNWLQGFAYRISISWQIFVIAGLLSVAIAVFTISFQAIKAALMNPVRSLRSE